MSEKKPTNRSEYVAPHATDVDRSLPSHDDIASLAHALWERRGGGDGGAIGGESRGASSSTVDRN
jgi:hypothetical protein